MKKLLLGLAFLGFTSLVFAQKKTDYSTISSLIMVAKEEGNVQLADSLAQDYINNYLFKLNKEELYTKENLRFIGDFLGNENSKAFKFFNNQQERINAVLGEYKTQNIIMKFIEMHFLPNSQTWRITRPNWDDLERTVVAKFGSLGEERLYEQRMLYYYEMEDWLNYGIWFKKYYEKHLKTTRLAPNNLCWTIFEKVDDPNILKFACDVVMPYTLEKWDSNDWQSYDTYSNLLYKTGKKEEAIKWEEKAAKLSNNDKSIVETLEKMKNNVATWTETAKN